MKIHFLLAEWNNLILANYVVPKEILLPFVPYKTELDLFNDEAYVSLAGFMFLNTRMMGLSVPRHINFEEINLRFYVRYSDRGNRKRGVAFIKQIVPRHAVSFIANNVFRENYETLKMKHFYNDNGDSFETGYEWNCKNKWNKLSAIAHKRTARLALGSREEFIANRTWGYTKYSDTKTYEYEVERQPWESYKASSHIINCDFAALGGEPFSVLNNATPKSVLIIKGSEIRILHRKLLE